MTEHMCQHNPMLYTTFWPCQRFVPKVTVGNFKPKPISALFTKSYTFHHFSSLSHRRPSVQAIGVIFEPANFHPVQQESYTIHHFSSLLDDVVPQTKPNFRPRSPYDAWRMPSIFDIVIRKMVGCP